MKKDKAWLVEEVYKLIEGYTSFGGHEHTFITGANVNKLGVLIDQLDEPGEPEVPVIPQFVADYIEENECLSLIYIGFKLFNNRIKDEDLNDWISNNQEQFCRAFLAWPNVEVEKEKKYYIYDKSTKGYLGYNADKTRLSWYTSQFPNDVFTEQDIKAIDKRYWAFAEEVTE